MWWSKRSMTDSDLKTALAEYHRVTLEQIRSCIPAGEPKKYLYNLVNEYSSRGGKGFRPSLCIATCRAFGGTLRESIKSAAALELFHNAFLIHDDVEDGSYFRRGKYALHQDYGIPIAINVGDAMNVLSIKPLMDNVKYLGPEISYSVFSEIEHMVRQSVEGQAIELGWRKDNDVDLADGDYFKMTMKKTCWYTCIHPLRIGAIIGTNGEINPDMFNRFGYFMGVAFQIQDDILNLEAEKKKYGKEIGGDILEGKRTLMLIHLLSNSNKRDKAFIRKFLAENREDHSPEDGYKILKLMMKYGSIEYSRKVAKTLAGASLKEFYSLFSHLSESKDKNLLRSIILYMVNREY